MSKKYYLTTPLYYVNDIPHIGHAYTTVAADVLARYQRLQGQDVHFLTGTDEHGQKIAAAAQINGAEPLAFVDQMAAGFKNAWQALNITYDDFIRTTESRHVKVVQAVFTQLLKQGDIYRGEYEGWYCVPCESFWSELELREDMEGRGLCPDCGRQVEIVKEQSYFFRLSKYQDRLLQHIEKHPAFISPVSRRNEIVQFIKQGLKDLSITRTTFQWGVPVPDDTKHVIYVWFDALINYISALGFPDGDQFQKYWPADVHLMGKEIVRFHAVTWPCMLMALGLPLPKMIFGHGWWTVEGKKMSKSKGNVVDPVALSEKYGVDAVRYFLLREVPFGTDGDFSLKSFILRYNADLANDLGNLLNRTLTMVDKYFKSEIPSPNDESISKDQMSNDLNEVIKGLPSAVGNKMERLAFSEALGEIWALVNKANIYIEQQAPWAIAKAKDEEKLKIVMFNLASALQVVAVMISPFMPSTAGKMWAQLGLTAPISLKTPLAGVKVAKGDPLFPRLELS